MCMNVFKKLYDYLFAKNSGIFADGKIKSLVSFEYRVASPEDILPGLGVAIAYDTKKMVSMNLSALKLRNILNLEDGSYIGCCYMVEYNGKVYGSMTGTNYIFSCYPQAFSFVKTNVVTIPLQKVENSEYFLLCSLNKKLYLHPNSVKMVNVSDKSEHILATFAKDCSFNEAIRYCQAAGYYKD